MIESQLIPSSSSKHSRTSLRTALNEIIRYAELCQVTMLSHYVNQLLYSESIKTH